MYRNLVLSSGGVNGLAIMGFLHKNIKSMDHIDNYFGSSIGSVLCVLLALNVPPFDIFILSLRLKQFNWSHQLEKILLNYIQDDTLEDFYHKTQKNVFITSYSMSDNKKIVYHYKTHPNISVLFALKRSCNFLNIKDDFYDGVLVSPLPITLCKSISQEKTWAICTQSHEKTIVPFEFIRILLDRIVELEIKNLTPSDRCTIINVTTNFLTFNLPVLERIYLFLQYAM
jgi:predicted acylesterase/phospholipase RssA